MMENTPTPKKRLKHPDRITLSPEALTRLSEMMGQIEEHLKGTRVTKSDLATFLVLSRPTRLSNEEIKELKEQHFDEVRFAQWALRELKNAKAQGKSLSLSDIMKAGKEAPK